MEPGRRPLALVALTALALGIAIAWLAPASLVDPRVAQATRGMLRVADTQGTIWHGRGVVAAASARIPIVWDVDFWPLLRGIVHVHVRSGVDAESPRSTIDVRDNEVTLHDTDVTVPAALIGGALGHGSRGLIEGEVNASTSNLRLAAGSNAGDARLVWRNAHLQVAPGSPPLDLGEVKATVIAKGSTLSGAVANGGGRVALAGDWTLIERDALTLAMRVTPRTPVDTELVRWLSAVGTAEGDGWRISWRLPLR